MAEEDDRINESLEPEMDNQLSRRREADWPAVLFFIHIHLLSIYGFWWLFQGVKLMTILFLISLSMLATLGATTGSHRLWAHRTYKASTGLRIVLMLCQTLTGQGSVYNWVQYHRFHHKYFGTENDPYDHNKGFFYAHIITRLRKLSPYQENLKSLVDMSDLENDSVVMFQKRFYWILYGIFFLLLPINAPLEYWDDNILSAIFVIGFLRYAIVLHAAWLIESAICIWGLTPGQKYPLDSNLVFIILKTFWPHYHYLLPRDYKSGEYGTYDSGCSTAFIRVWAALGLATDLQTMEPITIQKAMANAAKNNISLKTCLEQGAEKQILKKQHYLER